MLKHFVFNLKPIVRHDTMAGKNYLVAPMVMLTEGVHCGTEGAGYYPANILKKNPGVWNMKPIVVYHPQINGQGVSACDPQILSNRQVGVILNTKWKDGKLKAEAWLEEERCKAVDNRIYDAITNEAMMELSTGLVADVDENEGEWENERYDWAITNIMPDHLALLPDKQGACSIKDGAGFLRLNEAKGDVNKIKEMINEISHGIIRDALYSILKQKSDTAWIEAVYNEFFIYEDGGQLYKQDYKEVNNEVTFDGDPVVVKRIVEYRTEDGTFVANTNVKKGSDMNKEKVVQSLIDNEMTKWTEKDKEYLMNQDEEVLANFAPIEAVVESTTSTESEDTEVVANEPEKNVTNEPPKKKTVEEFINNDVPEEFRDMLMSGVAAHQAAKSQLVTKIMANERNKFTKEQLMTKKLDELKNIANLAVTEVKKPSEQPDNYFGAGIEPVDVVMNEDESPPPLPQLTFSK